MSDHAFRFEGETIPARAGDTIAAALLRAGHSGLSIGKDGAPRGYFCGMGVCHECLVTVDGRASQRACLLPAKDGLDVRRQAQAGVRLHGRDLAAVPDEVRAPEEVDVAIVGAGPGGLSAALTLAAAGLSVVVLDERDKPGGQYFKQPAQGVGDKQAQRGARLMAGVKAAGADIRSGALVWGGERDAAGRLAVWTLHGGASGVIQPRVLVIASGAIERPTVVPGWTLPGVMTVGAAQTLVRTADLAPGSRILVASNGPLALQLAGELLRLGHAPALVAEAAPPPWTRLRHVASMAATSPRLTARGFADFAALRRAGVPVRWSHRLRRLEGSNRVTHAVLGAVDSDGAFVQGRDRTLAVDAVCASDGFIPSAELARLFGCRHTVQGVGAASHLVVERDEAGKTSQPDIFVVGEAGAFGGAAIAAEQGRLAAATILRQLGGADRPMPSRRALRRHARFQKHLWALFAAPAAGVAAETDDMMICRCEAVRLGTLKALVATHAIADVGTLKRLSRAGMGRCQGRYCVHRLHDILGGPPTAESAFFAPQPPLRPVPLAALAVEKPEWGGHKRALLPSWQAPPGAPLPFAAVDTLVIGAGIVGLSTALFLAEAGGEVAVVDRGHANAVASGGNAGSLHVQLLSFDHGAKAEAGGTPAAQTLPLQRRSVALWRALGERLGDDLEVKITGGVMVAETDDDLRFLDAKTAIERRFGIDSVVIGAADLRAREPNLDPRFVGAAFCPDEGKVNPLVATAAIAAAAQDAGAQVWPATGVVAIERDGAAWRVHTSRGIIRAGRVVNAAGAFAAEIAAMVGCRIPVHGAPLQMVVTEAVEPLVNGLVAHADRHLTLKQARNGNIIIGGGWTATLDPVHQRPRAMRASLEGNLWVAQHVVPALRQLHVLRSWAAMNINIDGAPILGTAPNLPDFFHAVTSNGYTLGPLVGQITADLVLGRPAGLDLAPFSVTRFG